MNQAWLTTLGYTRDEVIGKNFADFLHPDWVDHFRVNFPRFKAIGEVLGVEFEMRKKDGSMILVAFNGKIGRDAKGGFLQTHCAFSDISELRRAEVALSESEQRYRTIFEQAPIGIVHCALDGRFLEINERFAGIVGYSREELLHMDFTSITHPDDQPGDLASIKHLLSGKSRQFSKDKRYVCKDGRIVWGHVKVSLMEDETGEPQLFLATVSDITERRQMMQALAASERNYRSIFEQAAVGIVNCSLDGRYLRVNPAFAEFIGYTEEELLQMDFKAITHPGDLPAGLAIVEGHHLGETSSSFSDKRYIRKDGSIVWGHLSTSVMVDETGDPCIYLGVVQNIHDRKMAEEALRESEHRHRVIFESSPLGMVSYDAEGVTLECNEKFVGLMGATRDKVIGFNLARQGSPEMREAIQKALAGEVSVYEGAYTSITGGKSTFIRIIFNPVTPGRLPSKVIATVEDVSKRRLAEEVIERRILSLTTPLEDVTEIDFQDLFNLDDIQRLQDEFARATGVASIITRTDGTPLTRPSSFTRLCHDVIRKTERGCANCHASDAALGRLSTEGPLVQPCMSGGLWDAGAGISVGGHHIANWLIGQVRDETQSEEGIRQYAREIGADEEAVVQAFQEVPVMSRKHFEDIAKVLFTLASRLSTTAYQNVQQARFITEIKEGHEKLRESEDRLRFALEGANDGLWDANLLTGEAYLSRRSYEILGYPADEMVGVFQKWKDLIHPDDFDLTWQRLVAHFQKQTPILSVEHRMHMKNGEWKWVLTRGKVVEWGEDGRALRMVGTNTDISERKKIEDAQLFLLKCGRSVSGEDLFETLARYLAENLHMDFVCINRLAEDNLSVRTLALYLDGHFQDTLTYTLQDAPCADVIGKTVYSCIDNVCQHYPDDAMLREIGAESYVGATLWNSQGKAVGLISAISRKPLASAHLPESVVKLVAIRAAGELERRESEAENANLQAQLMQAQKMESIGRLAGGVAHDFNNMLGVILGHAELAQDLITPADPIFEDLSEIKNAAQRSADLTRQLLAFARKQTVSPRVLDLNETVEGLLKMLRRLIGEDIDLAWLPGKGLWQVKIDPTQVDQILANLTVNARDAIEGVGKIIIATDIAELDADYCTDHVGCVPGHYVMLSISDDGCGMDNEIQEHIFEPFFTTKGVGQGTGLGLATIYGIVKQNSGYIDVHSRPDQGTTFRIYLPRYLGKVVAIEKTAEMIQQGQETILLVEDESSILLLGKRMLESIGYRVLTAGTPGEALWLAEQNAGEIHLLITDVVMPEMNGRDLAKRLLSLYPGLKRLFMSGYTADVIAHHGVLDEGVHFIQKPFSKTELSTKVRKILRGGA